MLFKVHYAFNLEYEVTLMNFYVFLEIAVYQIENSTAVPGSVLDFQNSINLLNIPAE